MKNLDQNQLEIRLTDFLSKQLKNSTTYFGYPEVSKNDDLSILGISGLAKLHLNNAGDPWIPGKFKMHTKEFEQEVLDFSARLYEIENDYWGYVTSGGTEGNLYGIYMGRKFFTQKQQKTIFLFSKASHYSIPKNARLLKLDMKEVDSLPSGEMDYEDLGSILKKIKKDFTSLPSLIINVNIGTIMTGAIDKVAQINKQVDRLGWKEENVFLHADAALMGFIYPFIESKEDLFKNRVRSISISGHKFPGAIHPCGIVLVNKDIRKKAFKKEIITNIGYIGTKDTTISGSRNGFLSLILWYLFQKKGVKGLKEEAKRCIKNTRYLFKKLKKMKYPNSSLFPNQTIVTFKKPSKDIVSKYQLATEEGIAHVVMMQHITRVQIDSFCREMERFLEGEKLKNL